MQRNFIGFAIIATVLGGCTALNRPGDGASGKPDAIPEQVVVLAAAYQDVSTARLRPDDGCYWYRHAGPVETTLLPLRTVEGRPICTAQE